VYRRAAYRSSPSRPHHTVSRRLNTYTSATTRTYALASGERSVATSLRIGFSSSPVL
jgi:hypothetical protein